MNGRVVKADRNRSAVVSGYVLTNESFSCNEGLDMENDANDAQ